MANPDSFILTEDEHRTRAMLMGLHFYQHLHLYGKAVDPHDNDFLEADTLEPAKLGGHGYMVVNGDKGCKVSS